MRRCWALVCAVVVGGAVAAEPVSIIASRRMEVPPPPAATHHLTVHAYTFHGTRWRNEEVAESVLAASKLLAQCGVALTQLELHVVRAPPRFHYYSTPVSRELARRLQVAKPAIFFVEDTRNEPAFDAEAIGLSNSKPRPELANTVWIAYGASDLFLAVAHELVHVLSDSGEHSTEPGNLMRDETAPGNTRLTPRQCDLLRSKAEATGLLRRSAR